MTPALTLPARSDNPRSSTWLRLSPPVASILTACCVVVGWSQAQLSAAASLRVGTAKVDITPERPVNMAGYESRKELSQGVHDLLSARAVAFEADGQRVVLVSTDVLGFYGGSIDVLRSNLLEQCQLSASELFLSAIHTHSAPTVTFDSSRGHSNNIAYSVELQKRLRSVIEAAVRDLQPAQIGFGVGSSPVGANRRQTVTDENGKPKIVLGRNPQAMTDRDVQVVKITRGDGGLAAALFSFPTHSTSLGPQNYIISGDVHGLAEQFAEKYLGSRVIVPGFAGTSGNIDPWYRVLPGFKTDNGWVPETVLMGTLLGEEVVRTLDSIRGATNAVPVQSRFEILSLPAKPKEGSSSADATPARLNVTLARVGPIAFVGLGGEVFNEIGLAIKARSPFPLTFVLTHCNGTAGYLPTRESYEQGGYEVQSSPFGPGAAEQIPEQIVPMLQELWNQN
jgi:hypothetical protein